jgi:EAL domain-containing protein (putative c-di-GMP-specific phosphodiesterase class I)
MPAQQESTRAHSARHYLVDGPLIARLEATLALVSRSLGFPVVRVNILEEDTQHTISMFGVGDIAAIPRIESFCDAIVRSGRPLRIEDAGADARVSQLPSVVSGEIGAYLGVPLLGRESFIVGAVCVIDPNRRRIDDDQQARLADFARIVEDQLDLIRRLREQRLEGEVATTELARAIKSGEVIPWYQEVVDLATDRTVGYEALARWEHPSGIVDDPRRFVPVAEDSDLIIELDLAVMRQAMFDLKRWQRNTPELRMSVNLSARHFDHADCVTRLLAVTVNAGVLPGSVYLELTETLRLTPMQNHVAVAVQQLRDIGFQVWLDDFGTGWSSLDQLLWLQVDGIKIDRAVTIALGTPIGDALTQAVTGLGHALGLRTTIEGIETQGSAELARDRGCDYGQGYLWAAPLPAGAVNILRDTRPYPQRPDTPLERH